MRDELDRKLVEKYPLLYKNRYGNPRETLMCWGFCCGDGWYQLIDRLSAMLYGEYANAKRRYDQLCVWKLETGRFPWNGGKEITHEMVVTAKEEMEAAEKNIPVVVQVKEKFGTLRFYADNCTERNQNFISMAEAMSERICEECGSMDETVRTWPLGWHRTLCEQHACESYSAETVQEFYRIEEDEDAEAA